MKVLDQGILYRNPFPEKESIHAYYPDMLQLSEQEFICVYWRTPEPQSAEGRMMQLRSTNGGDTWQDEGLVYDLSGDDRLFSYRANNLTRLSDGTILITTTRWDRSDPDKPYYNPETDGYLPCDIILFRSSDLGHTWSSPQVVPLPKGIVGNFSGPAIELPENSILLPFETWKLYDDPGPVPQSARALFSRDWGYSWSETATVANGIDDGIYYSDQRIISLDNSRLFAIFWTNNFIDNKDLPLHTSFSEDGGTTWSKPQSTGIPGQVVCPLHIGGGRILLVYNLRFGDQPGVMGILSEDYGASWDFDNQIRIWDPLAHRDAARVSGDKTIAASLTEFSFGKPNASKLMNGSIMVCFWSTVDGISDIRWAKLSLD